VRAAAEWADTYQYLKDLLERLPTQPASLVRDLLPYCWQAAGDGV
jgi:hypothetical protein